MYGDDFSPVRYMNYAIDREEAVVMEAGRLLGEMGWFAPDLNKNRCNPLFPKEEIADDIRNGRLYIGDPKGSNAIRALEEALEKADTIVDSMELSDEECICLVSTGNGAGYSEVGKI